MQSVISSVWAELLPSVVLKNLGVLSLVLLGYLVEKHYVSRPALFANAVAINIHVSQKQSPPDLLAIYANGAVIMGVLAIYSYWMEESQGELFYNIAWLYSSITVGIVIFLTW